MKNIFGRYAKLIMNNSNQEEYDENTGRWTHVEHLSFIEGIKLHGKNWKLVAKHIGSRSSTQVRSHAQKYFLRENTRHAVRKQAKEYFSRIPVNTSNIEKKDAATQYGEGVNFPNLILNPCLDFAFST